MGADNSAGPLRKAGLLLWRLPDLLCVPLGLGIPGVMFTAVLARYSNLFSIPWSGEVVRSMILWFSFLGAAAAVRLKAHFRLAMLVTKAPYRVRHAIEVANTVTFTLLGIGLVAFGWVLMDILALQRTPVLGWSLGMVYTVVPLSGVWITAYSLVELAQFVRGHGPPSNPQADADASLRNEPRE